MIAVQPRKRPDHPPEVAESVRRAYNDAPDASEWDTPDLAAIARCSCALIEKLRTAGTGPAFLVFGRRVRYRKTDIEQWLTEVKKPARNTAQARAARRPLLPRVAPATPVA